MKAATKKFRLKENAFGRFVIQHPTDDALGWSGLRWVPMDEWGVPAGDVQISNFDSKETAAKYAKWIKKP